MPQPADNPSAVTLTYRRETFTARPGMTVRKAVEQIGLNPESVLAVRDGQLITDEVVLESGDRVKLVATISGG
ncbi:MAG: MoaD/ThiS family protein [Chloroflexi bacterium]|nr:MoaD/ThiS family protein [Chloroflexota bacterium]